MVNFAAFTTFSDWVEILLRTRECTDVDVYPFTKTFLHENAKGIGTQTFPHQASVVQRSDNFIQWISRYPGSKIFFTLNIDKGF